MLESLKKEIANINAAVEIDCVQSDLTSEEDVNSLWNSSVEKFGTIDVVISCAASRSQMKKIGDTDIQGWWSDFVCQLDVQMCLRQISTDNISQLMTGNQCQGALSISPSCSKLEIRKSGYFYQRYK